MAAGLNIVSAMAAQLVKKAISGNIHRPNLIMIIGIELLDLIENEFFIKKKQSIDLCITIRYVSHDFMMYHTESYILFGLAHV